MIEGRRGAVHTLEAFLAAVIIFSTLLYSAVMPREKELPEGKPLEDLGMEALLKLDQDGILGRLIESRSWVDLERCLRTTLPVSVSFNLTVLDEEGAKINDRSISSGGLVGHTIASVDYLLAVESAALPFYTLRLHLGGNM